jgi:hypothetical protein
MVPTSASADGQIVVYFDEDGTARSRDAGPVGAIVPMWIYGENFRPGVPFVSGAQFAVDYAPNIEWFADTPVYPASIGNTRDGYSVGFGTNLQDGTKFLIVRSRGYWTNDCTAGLNVDGPFTTRHPDFPDPTPLVTRFPDQAVFPAGTARSQTCQIVELDINPLWCPNKFPGYIWEMVGSGTGWKAGWMAVAILGSETFDVNDIDRASLRMGPAGNVTVAPEPWPQTTFFDVGLADGVNDCVCDDFPNPSDDDDDDEALANFLGMERDGYKDLLLYFDRAAVAAAIGPVAPPVGSEIELFLEGVHSADAFPFSSMDCIVISGGTWIKEDFDDKSHSSDSDDNVASLGFPSPNPFNPVTRISYNVPMAQHVNIAIYDVAGRLVESLVNETKSAGEYVVEWDAGRLPSGVYFYRMQTGERTIVRRATLLK